jgi:mono/diheme cytochrome c family protein
MHRWLTLAIFVIALSFGQDKVEYGRYLTVEVGKCQECHTPRLETGQPDKSKWMKGSTLDFQPINDVKGWHKTAPDLTPAGKLWTRWGEEGLAKFLTTGVNPKGNPADPPMPAYKLKQADAEAVVAYLKSLQ